MAPEDACPADMLDDATSEAIADWHYWVAQGKLFLSYTRRRKLTVGWGQQMIEQDLPPISITTVIWSQR